MQERHLKKQIEQALEDTPVLLLHGARQTGKTTLARQLVEERGGSYRTLDDGATFAAAAASPGDFVSRTPGFLVIDEVQNVPELLPAIKVAVDQDRRPGRFHLTGSADVLLLPTVSESLAGRMEVFTLRPFSQGEIEGRVDRFIDAVFADDLPALADPKQDEEGPDLLQRVLRGGFPEIVTRRAESRRQAWFSSYLTTILQRDIRDLSNIEGLSDMPRLLELLASRSSALLNRSEISRTVGLPYATLHRYMSLLEMTHLLQLQPAWSGNVTKRLSKAPKVDLLDSGLIAHLTSFSADRLEQDPKRFGPLLESFVAGELRKQASWAKTAVRLYHYRTSDRQEVDLLLEDRAGRIVGIEVKAGSSWGKNDLRGLRALEESVGPRFHRGILLYGGDVALPCGPRLDALPIRALWEMGED